MGEPNHQRSNVVYGRSNNQTGSNGPYSWSSDL